MEQTEEIGYIFQTKTCILTAMLNLKNDILKDLGIYNVTLKNKFISEDCSKSLESIDDLQ